MNSNKAGGIEMTNPTADMSLRKAALVAGLGYLIFIFILGGFTNFIARQPLIVPGDAATTASNIMASESLFRTGLAAGVILLVADAVVAWALYIFLTPVNKGLSLLAAWFRLLFVAISGMALLNLFRILLLLSGADYLSAFETGQLQAQAMLFLGAHDFAINISYVFFGLNIFLLGYLIFKSSYVPRFLGVLLMIAFVGYQIDSFASFLSSDYADNEALFFLFVAAPAILAEFSLTLWLLIRGRKVQLSENRNLESAQKTLAEGKGTSFSSHSPANNFSDIQSDAENYPYEENARGAE